jgi:hypothetical protein
MNNNDKVVPFRTRTTGDEGDRGTGRTTRQLQTMPQDGVFVWCNSSLLYPRQLANHLGRHDVRIVAPIDLGRLRGITLTAIRVDHAALLSNQQHDLIEALRRTIKKP